MKKILSKLLSAVMAVIVMISCFSAFAAVPATTKSAFTKITYTHNSKFSNRTLKNGLDLSYHNGELTDADWQAFKKAGVDFVMLRVGYRGYGTEGTLNEKTKDAKFDTYIKSAEKVGMPVGVYIYSQAISTAEAEEEARFVLKYIKNYKIDLPVVFDYEFAESDDKVTGRLWNKYKSLGTTNTKVAFTNNCLAFCRVVRNAGYTPMLYASASFIKDYMNPTVLAKNDCKVWLAHYTSKTDYQYDYEFWQYSESGKIDGVVYRAADGEVSKVGQQKVFDCNFWYYEKSLVGAVPSPTPIKKPDAVQNVEISEIATNSAKLKWDEVEGADGYIVQKVRYDGSVASTVGQTTESTYNLTGLSSATNIGIKITAFVNDKNVKILGEPSQAKFFTTYPNKPVLSCTSTDKTVTLTWTKQSNASGTYIYYYDYVDAKYKYLAKVTGSVNTYKVTGLTPNSKNRFRVRSYKTDLEGKTLWGGYCDSVLRYTNPKAPTIKTAAYVSSKTFKTTWSKVSGISGYQIEWSSTSDFSSNKKSVNASSTAVAKNISTYYAKRYYYVHVRAYKVRNNEKQYSPWSKALKVYIKK